MVMAINFPDNPTIGDTYTSGQRTWRWDGVSWNAYGIVPDPTVLRIDSANGRVGINNSSPAADLDVTGDINLSGNITVGGSYVGLSSDAITDADGDTKIQVEESADEDTIRFDIAGAEKMTLDSSSLTVSDGVSADHFSASGTGANLIPSGTTAERPVSPTAGMIRFNETTGEPEWYSSVVGDWVNFRNAPPIPPITISYLVIAGGGGGGGKNVGGGGGAGGYRNSYASETSGGGGSTETPLTVNLGRTYSVTVGAGGSGVSGSAKGGNGSDSVFATIASTGGGGGSNGVPPNSGGSALDGLSGGSGGGGGGVDTAPAGSGGSGTSNQGYAGGNGNTGASGGGGGGAGSEGANASTSSGANGGSGVASSITGSSVIRAGGGGGGGNSSGGTGGSGVGGAGGYGNPASTAGDGSENTGSGGGANGGYETTKTSGSGGSGIVILRYSNAIPTPTVSAGLTSTTTTVGSDKVTVFTAGTGTVSWG